MSDETKTMLKLSDDSIGMIRDLLQLSILLNINIIDNLRAMRFEVNPATGNLVPAEEYVVAYNAMVTNLEAQVDAVLSEQEGAEQVVVADTEEEAIITDKSKLN